MAVTLRSALSTVPQASPRVARLVTEKAELAAQRTALDVKLKDIGDKLLKLVHREGEPDDEGKIRLETDSAKLQIIPGKNETISKKKLIAMGVKPKLIAQCTDTVEYEYVGVYAKKG